MFAVTAQDIQIAGGQNAMPVRLRNENRQVGNNVVNGTVRKYEVVCRQTMRAKPLRIHRDRQHRGARGRLDPRRGKRAAPTDD